MVGELASTLPGRVAGFGGASSVQVDEALAGPAGGVGPPGAGGGCRRRLGISGLLRGSRTWSGTLGGGRIKDLGESRTRRWKVEESLVRSFWWRGCARSGRDAGRFRSKVTGDVGHHPCPSRIRAADCADGGRRDWSGQRGLAPGPGGL